MIVQLQAKSRHGSNRLNECGGSDWLILAEQDGRIFVEPQICTLRPGQSKVDLRRWIKLNNDPDFEIIGSLV